MDNLLDEHFEFRLDDRYHCKYCYYNSQLPNKAMAHLQKKHGDQLAAAEQPQQDQETGQAEQEQGQEPKEWLGIAELESDQEEH
jgi:hypothetical protein